MAKRKIQDWILCAGIALFLLHTQMLEAQNLQTAIDRQSILIGEQLQYKVKAIFPTNDFKVEWFSLPDSIAHFEVVDRGRIDSTVDNNSTTLQQTITYTSFDSGKWNTPALMISFAALNNGNTINLYSDSIPVTVGYSPSDSTGLRDIKSIIEVRVTDYFWYYFAGGLLSLLILILVLWRYFKNRESKSAERKYALSAYDEAIAALAELKTYDLAEKEVARKYHTRLSEIFKRYIGRKQNKSLFNTTSSDMLVILSASFNNSDIASIASVLRTGDAVKFAKYFPSAIESNESREKITAAIKLMELHSKEKL